MKIDLFKIPDCTYCGICNPACPFFYVQRKEHLSPRAWTYSLNNHSHDYSSLLGLARNCFFCFRCYKACPLNVNYPAALLWNLFQFLIDKDLTFSYHENSTDLFLQCHLPAEIELGLQKYPLSLDSRINLPLKKISNLNLYFPGKKLFINTYFFHLIRSVAHYYRKKTVLTSLPEYWNLGRLLTDEKLFVTLPVIPEFLPSSTLQVHTPPLQKLIEIPVLKQRLDCASFHNSAGDSE